jgi:hypothetical protein
MELLPTLHGAWIFGFLFHPDIEGGMFLQGDYTLLFYKLFL